jgi:hypothetical protein
VLITSGSGVGVKRCFKIINKALTRKGASRINEVNIPNAKMEDKEFIFSSFEKALQETV